MLRVHRPLNPTLRAKLGYTGSTPNYQLLKDKRAANLMPNDRNRTMLRRALKKTDLSKIRPRTSVKPNRPYQRPRVERRRVQRSPSPPEHQRRRPVPRPVEYRITRNFRQRSPHRRVEREYRFVDKPRVMHLRPHAYDRSPERSGFRERPRSPVRDFYRGEPNRRQRMD